MPVRSPFASARTKGPAQRDASDDADGPLGDTAMTFGEHLDELRKHLLRAGWGVVIAVVATFPLGPRLVQWLTGPLEVKLKEWHTKRQDDLLTAYAAAQKEIEGRDGSAARATVRLRVSVGPEDLAELLKRTGVPAGRADPATLQALPLALKADAAELLDTIKEPLARITEPWAVRTFSVQEAMMLWVKVALVAGLLLASPWVFYQLYSFIAVGLYSHERRLVNTYLPFSILLFFGGVAFCYVLMFQYALEWMLQVNVWMGLTPDIRVSEWINFCLLMVLVFGAAFQLPLLMLVLGAAGIVSAEMLASKRRIALFGIFVFAAFAAPIPEPVTQTLMALPLYGLFELGLYLMRRAAPGRRYDVAEDNNW